MAAKQIYILVGSLREGSFNKKIANEVVKLASQNLACEILQIGQLTHYNEDLDQGDPPLAWVQFRDKIKKADGFLFFTPEYNRGVPAVLKNALDVGSRPYGKNAWAGKPGAVISVSLSSLGAFGANHQLRQSMVFLDVPMMPQPEAYIGNAQNLFDDTGNLAKDTKEFLKTFIGAYENWVNRPW
ncbi:NADPH-dependent FMN reductase [Parapedobacter pyrenivorans]|uniref:NADPH-dependent FMN reductase n=1 Tax=Parapedobacter pyrenivorans TaxID=1305674 RepID=A0A917MEC6_9SPHI|nr:NAD(P)H-dependent oxidoreductase [Parapedobacter pyrenivorans]GGH02236.1 NADPH-dependent FMN reductase [Parapedobacter pyrenivorans]